MIRSSLILLTAAISLTAQDKLAIPLSAPGQPATIRARLLTGSVSITAGSGPDLIVEEKGAAAHRHNTRDTAPPGMHRLDAGAAPGSLSKRIITLSPFAPAGRATPISPSPRPPTPPWN